jgi:hypothetical protein
VKKYPAQSRVRWKRVRGVVAPRIAARQAAEGERQQARKEHLPCRLPSLKAIRGKPRASARHGALQMPTLTSLTPATQFRKPPRFGGFFYVFFQGFTLGLKNISKYPHKRVDILTHIRDNSPIAQTNKPLSSQRRKQRRYPVAE